MNEYVFEFRYEIKHELDTLTLDTTVTTDAVSNAGAWMLAIMGFFREYPRATVVSAEIVRVKG